MARFNQGRKEVRYIVKIQTQISLYILNATVAKSFFHGTPLKTVSDAVGY